MNESALTRRFFLQTAAAGTAAVMVGNPWMQAAQDAKPVTIDEPFHGAVLNRRHGEQTAGGLKIRVCGKAPAGARVTVRTLTPGPSPGTGEGRREAPGTSPGTGEGSHESAATRQGEAFTAEVVLRNHETEIVAVAESAAGRAEDRVRVVWDKHSQPRYRFAIDDNIYFLRDIAQHGYRSLFDCFYLDMLRKLHRQYGAKFALNIYFATDQGDGDAFDLTQFPDRYKKEWQDNADWLRLAFHAYADSPSRPYQNASPEQVLADFDKVVAQVHRFAGEQAYSPTTITHWAMLPPAVFKPLAQRGVKVLSGYFRQRDGKWDINYNLDDARSEYLSRHDALKDFDSGIVFTRVDLVCNHIPSIDHVIPTLEPLARDPNQAEIMDLTSHEQPTWPFWRGHLPDHGKRIETAIRWVTERDYRPVFFHEGFLGGPQ